MAALFRPREQDAGHIGAGHGEQYSENKHTDPRQEDPASSSVAQFIEYFAGQVAVGFRPCLRQVIRDGFHFGSRLGRQNARPKPGPEGAFAIVPLLHETALPRLQPKPGFHRNP